MTVTYDAAERVVRAGVEWLCLTIETLGAVVIVVGVIIASVELAHHVIRARDKNFMPIWLGLARHLTLALELQLAADVLATAVEPTWERIGKLAAIAALRTALNFFLNEEMKDERRAAG